MIATFVTWPYGTLKATHEKVVIMGFREGPAGEVRPIVASLATGELSVVQIDEVAVDADKLLKLPL